MELVCFHSMLPIIGTTCSFWGWGGGAVFFGGGGGGFLSKSKSQNVKGGWGNKESTFLIHFVL